MRISEILFEDKESIELFLILAGNKSFKKYQEESAYFKQSMQDKKYKDVAWSWLFQLNSELEFLLESDIWNQFSDDSDVEQIFDEYATLHEENYDILMGFKS